MTRKHPTKTNGQEFLQELADASSNTFTRRFSEIATRLDLGVLLEGHELSLLYEAALYSMMCYIAINGLGEAGGEIKPEAEGKRMNLERKFMAARDELYSSAGWKTLPISQKHPAERIFLNVFVTEDNLEAWV
jgi:hypothetical protein